MRTGRLLNYNASLQYASAPAQLICFPTTLPQLPILIRRLFSIATLLLATCLSSTSWAEDAKPLNVLLITGVCRHDYRFQAEAIQKVFKDAEVEVNWKIVNEGGNGTDAEIEFYKDPQWAKGFDVVIHNECFADTTKAKYIRSRPYIG